MELVGVEHLIQYLKYSIILSYGCFSFFFMVTKSFLLAATFFGNKKTHRYHQFFCRSHTFFVPLPLLPSPSLFLPPSLHLSIFSSILYPFNLFPKKYFFGRSQGGGLWRIHFRVLSPTILYPVIYTYDSLNPKGQVYSIKTLEMMAAQSLAANLTNELKCQNQKSKNRLSNR